MASQAAHAKVVNIDGNPAPANSANLARGGTLLDDTNFADANYISRITGLRDYSVNLSCPYDSGDTAIAAIITKWASGAAVAVQYLHDGTNGWAGSCLVESCNISGDVAGLETFEAVLQGDGTALSALP